MNEFTLEAKFQFEAAHKLPHLPAEHKCARLHGHSFHVTIAISGKKDSRLGWVMDFGEIRKVVQDLLDKNLDHYYLNEVHGLENPTSENIAVWLWEKLAHSLPGLTEIQVGETCETACRYRK